MYIWVSCNYVNIATCIVARYALLNVIYKQFNVTFVKICGICPMSTVPIPDNVGKHSCALSNVDIGVLWNYVKHASSCPLVAHIEETFKNSHTYLSVF
jgi:hypothetical protein